MKKLAVLFLLSFSAMASSDHNLLITESLQTTIRDQGDVQTSTPDRYEEVSYRCDSWSGQMCTRQDRIPGSPIWQFDTETEISLTVDASKATGPIRQSVDIRLYDTSIYVTPSEETNEEDRGLHIVRITSKDIKGQRDHGSVLKRIRGNVRLEVADAKPFVESFKAKNVTYSNGVVSAVKPKVEGFESGMMMRIRREVKKGILRRLVTEQFDVWQPSSKPTSDGTLCTLNIREYLGKSYRKGKYEVEIVTWMSGTYDIANINDVLRRYIGPEAKELSHSTRVNFTVE